MTPAGGVRRILAVFIDFFVFFALWLALGVFIAVGSIYYALAVFFLVDVALTSLFGVSAGRFLSGIRVARIDGGRPGPWRALVRTALVFATGWAGLLWVSLSLWWDRDGGMSSRLWWDAAAGTRLVSARQHTQPPRL